MEHSNQSETDKTKRKILEEQRVEKKEKQRRHNINTKLSSYKRI